jgi:photosystem II stability/assembly factor-like uncharacterized protein
MYLIRVLIALLLSNSLFAQSYGEIYFYDELNGMKIFRNQLINKYVLSITEDGGDTWDAILEGTNMKGLSMLSAQELFVGYQNNGIRFSEDGGASWETKPLVESSVYVKGIQFKNSNYGIISADRGVFITTDSGENWTETTMDHNWLDVLGTSFIQANKGWLVKEDGSVYKYKQNGASSDWTFISDLGGVCYGNNAGVTFVDSLIGYAVGRQYSYKTTDGGNSWNKIPAASLRNIHGYFVINKDKILLCGEKGIMYSNNGGSSFSTKYYKGIEVQSIHFIDSSYGWAIDSKDNIIKTTDGGLTWSDGIVANNFPPTIISVIDRPYDNGGYVLLEFERSDLDGLNNSEVITDYNVYKIIQNKKVMTERIKPSGQDTYVVELSTIADSNKSGKNLVYFQIDAVTQNAKYYSSNVASGYSVDNISPEPPSSLNGILFSNNIELNWKHSNSSDVTNYYIYRSFSENFIIDTLNIYSEVDDSVYIDSSIPVGETDYLYYAVYAVDASGNISNNSAKVSVSLVTVGVGNDAIPTEVNLFQNYPNPFNPETLIEFHLDQISAVKLEIFDSNGELVKVLLDEKYATGKHSMKFNASSLSSGVYFYKLSTRNRTITKKMILLR